LLAASFPLGAAPPVGFEALKLERLPELRDAKCFQASSHDPTGGNDDQGHFVARHGGTAVLADIAGPGCLYRIWSANPGGQVKIYFDGEKTPRVDAPFREFLAGQIEPFGSLCGNEGGGGYCYYPFPFRQGCRVEVENAPPLYYQVTYHTFPDAAGFPTFSRDAKPPLRAEGQGPSAESPDPLLSALGSVPYDVQQALQSARGPSSSRPLPGRRRAFQGTLAPGQAWTLADLSGAGIVRRFQLDASTLNYRLLRELDLRLAWDGEPTPSVLAPVGDFFTCGWGLMTSFSSLPMRNLGSEMECDFPMPFANGARFELVNRSDRAVQVAGHLLVDELKAASASLGRFHAQFRQATTEAGKPYVLVEAQGRGHYVGCTMTMIGDSDLKFLEGDERIFVDGETAPSLAGTGTEDYFNGGWYFLHGPFQTPFAGAPRLCAGKTQVVAYRWQVSDCVPFTKSLRVEMEHGGQNDAPGGRYRSVAYWYQTEPHAPFPPLPPPEPMPAYREPDVTEGESLVQGVGPAGTEARVEEDRALPQPASGGQYLSLRRSEPPAQAPALTLSLPAREGGVYDVWAQWVLGPEGGRFHCELGGKPLGRWFYSYSPFPHVKRVRLGRVRLRGGSLPFSLVAEPPEPGEELPFTPRCALGLDYLQFVPVARVKGALEAEELQILSASPPEAVRVEDWENRDAKVPLQPSPRVVGGGPAGAAEWSGAAQLLFNARQPGDTVTLALPVRLEGQYELVASFTRGPAYGRVRLLLDGKPLGGEMDTYAESLFVRDRLGLGVTPPLTAGDHPLTVEVVGKNEAASGYQVGLDYVLLKAVAGGYEAENLFVIEASDPVVIKERFGAEPRWRAGAYLRLEADAVGDFLTLGLPVSTSGLYQLALSLARAGTGGQFQAEIHGRPLGEPVDNYSEVETTGSATLGEIRLRRGTWPLTLKVTGQNPASTGFDLALDQVELTLLKKQGNGLGWLLAGAVAVGLLLLGLLRWRKRA